MTRSKHKRIKILFVVNGQPYNKNILINQLLRISIEKLLKGTGNIGQASSEWEVRDSLGVIKNQNLILSDLNLQPNQTLYVNLKAGVGG